MTVKQNLQQRTQPCAAAYTSLAIISVLFRFLSILYNIALTVFTSATPPRTTLFPYSRNLVGFFPLIIQDQFVPPKIFLDVCPSTETWSTYEELLDTLILSFPLAILAVNCEG
jgi:hypothetical protein